MLRPDTLDAAHRAPTMPLARFAAALVVLALLAGCERRGDVLAEVGSRTVTTEDFTNVIKGNEANYPFAPDSAKKLALRDMVRRELMVNEALKRGFDKDPATLALRHVAEERVLIEALYEKLAPADVPVSDAEVEKFYSWRDSASRLLVIYTPERSMADAALQALERGEPFEEVANRFSLPGVLPGGGDLGYRLAGDLVDPLDELMRTSAPGTVAGPVEAPTEGWFLLKVIDRVPRERRPLEEEKGALHEMLRQRKQRSLASKAFTMLRDRYAVAATPGGPQALFTFFNQEQGATADSALRSLEVGTMKDASGKPISYTFGDALSDIDDGSRQRPNITLLPAIERWIESQLLRRAAFMEAERRGLASEPAIKKRIENEVYGHMVDGLFTLEVVNAISASDEEIRAAYAGRPDLADTPFEELPPVAQHNLRNEVLGLKTEARFVAFTDSLAAITKPYRVHEEKLARLPWNPAPGLMPPGAPGAPGAPPTR